MSPLVAALLLLVSVKPCDYVVQVSKGSWLHVALSYVLGIGSSCPHWGHKRSHAQ